MCPGQRTMNGARTLGAAQKAVAVEERGIGSSFFVRAVVAGEDDDGVVIESLFLELGQNLTYIGVQARNHAGELGVHVVCGIIAASAVTSPRFVIAEMSFVSLQDGVVGLHQFGVRECIGEETVERLVGRLVIEPFEGFLMNHVCRIL